MKAQLRVLACVAAIVCSGLTGCEVGVPDVHDLNVVAVDVVKFSDAFPGTTSPGDPDRLVKVTFSTRSIAYRYAPVFWYPSGAFYECDKGMVKGFPLNPAPGGMLHEHYGIWDVHGDFRTVEETKGVTQPYYTFLKIRNESMEIHRAAGTYWLAGYDLEKYPLDLCYQLHLAAYGRDGPRPDLGYFHSNIAPIPKEAIAAAFERARELADMPPAK